MAKEKAPTHNPLELKKMLKAGEYARVYVFFGEESFLRNHYVSQLKKQMVDELTESFNYHKLTQENFDIRSFSDCVESLPVMAEHTLVWIDDIDVFKLSEDEREKVAQILLDIPEYCTVLFTYETVTWHPDGRFKKLYQAMVDNGYVVEFPKQNENDLIPWIIRHFAAGGKTIAPNLCKYLMELSGGTMTALAGEIKKICAFSGADTIVKSDIDAVVEPSLDVLMYEISKSLSNGNYYGALTQLQMVLKRQEKPVAILGVIGSHFRELSAARVVLDSGEGYGKLAKLFPKRQDFVIKRLLNSAKNFSPRFYKAASKLILEADLHLKTSYDEPERILEMLIMELAQEARNG